MKTAKKFLLAGCSLLALPSISMAYCINNGNWFFEYTMNLPSSLSFPRNKYNVGDTIWKSPRIGNTFPINSISCNGDANDYEWGVITNGTLTTWSIATNVGGSPSYPPPTRVVYQSNVPGIGVAWYFYDNAADPDHTVPRPLYSYGNKTFWSPLPYNTYRNSPDPQLELVKTGPIAAGGTLNLSGNKAQIWYGGNNAPGATGSAYSGSLYLSSDISITVSTCQLTTPNVVVTMPKISVNAFSSGPDAGRTNFNIGMNCSDTKASYTLSGNFLPSNYTLLVPTGTASGVYFQLRDRATNNAMILDGNTTYYLGDATGQSNVPFTIQLAAQYHKNGTVTPGTVNGSVALNMLYQ